MLTASVIGNLGNDPEMRYAQSGTATLRFNVATNGRAKNADGQWEDRTEWVRVTVFGQRAESLNEYLRKGTRVFVYGRLEARPWTTKDGDVRAGLEVIASDVDFMSSRQNDEQPAQAPRGKPQKYADDDDGDLDSVPF